MPSGKSARDKRKLARDKKKPRADNYRKGGEPIHFNFFRSHLDLDVQIKQRLAEIEGKTDDESQRKRVGLEKILPDLPTKIPSRDGYPPIAGERDHFYIRFFHLMTDHLRSNRYFKNRMYDHNRQEFVEMYSDRQSWELIETRRNLYYLDEGENHPAAKRPRCRRLEQAHIKYMKAKRLREEQAGK